MGGKLKSGLKLVQEADQQLASLIAARMAGQLEAIPQVLPGLAQMQKLNLPAAYAGDQRSLQAAQRAISESETGLQSPGRRKILKQGAATAARAAIPDSVANALGTTALKKAVQDAVSPTIPDESIQAAYALAFKRALKDRLINKVSEESGVGPFEFLQDVELYNPEGNITPKEIDQLTKLMESLQPESIAKTHGLPPEAVASYVKKHDLYPQEQLDEWLNIDNMVDMIYDDGARSVKDKVFRTPEPGVWWDKAKEIAAQPGEERFDALHDHYWQHANDRYMEPHYRLLGRKAAEELDKVHAGPQYTWDAMSEVSAETPYGDKFMSKLLKQLGL